MTFFSLAHWRPLRGRREAGSQPAQATNPPPIALLTLEAGAGCVEEHMTGPLRRQSLSAGPARLRRTRTSSSTRASASAESTYSHTFDL